MSDVEDMERIAALHASVSDKIRALAAAGYKRADIARALGKRYQHVRNVLEQDALKSTPVRREAAGMAEAEGRPFAFRHEEAGGLYRFDVQPDGSIRLPQALEQALGLSRGGVVIGEFTGDRLVLLSAASAMRRAQDLVRALIPGSDSLAQSLIEDRRLEVEHD